MPDRITTEELHLGYRVVAALADENPERYVERLILEAAADILRVHYRTRTRHDPLPGQLELSDSRPIGSASGLLR